MSHKPSKAYYVEGVHRFWIDEGYVVCRIECSDYYARQAQNFCGGCKEMDFLLYHPERRDLWLVEVKDYRFDARPKVGELVCALSRKVRDTMFLLRAASVAAPHEEPAEGISLRDFSILASEAETLHLAFLLEMGMGGVWSDGGVLANVKNGWREPEFAIEADTASFAALFGDGAIDELLIESEAEVSSLKSALGAQ